MAIKRPPGANQAALDSAFASIRSAWDSMDAQHASSVPNFKGSVCTKDCSGHRAGYEWSKNHNGAMPKSRSMSFEKGAALHRKGTKNEI